MKILILAAVGLAGGILGGMGMGGGTLMIPLLTLAAGAEQHLAQSINLAAFIPTSVAALVYHIRKKRVHWQSVLLAALPSSAAGVGASFLAEMLSAAWLKRMFGASLLALGIWRLVSAIIDLKRKRRKESDEASVTVGELYASPKGLFVPRDRKK